MPPVQQGHVDQWDQRVHKDRWDQQAQEDHQVLAELQLIKWPFEDPQDHPVLKEKEVQWALRVP